MRLYLLAGSPFLAACDRTQAADHVLGQLPGRHQTARPSGAAEEKPS